MNSWWNKLRDHRYKPFNLPDPEPYAVGLERVRKDFEAITKAKKAVITQAFKGEGDKE